MSRPSLRHWPNSGLLAFRVAQGNALLDEPAVAPGDFRCPEEIASTGDHRAKLSGLRRTGAAVGSWLSAFGQIVWLTADD